MQRLTISLDDDLAAALDEFVEHAGDSKALLVRRALRAYIKRQHGTERPTDHDLKVWTHLLANREHVILDVAHVRLLFEQCTDAPETFWRELHEIGAEHGRQYRDRGITRVEEVLHIIASANWFHVSPESDRSWALVVIEGSSKPFLRAFLQGFLSEYPGRPEVIEERTKLRIRLAAPAPNAQGGARAGRTVRFA